MKVATYPDNFCVQVRSHSSQERKPVFDQGYAARENNEKEKGETNRRPAGTDDGGPERHKP